MFICRDVEANVPGSAELSVQLWLLTPDSESFDFRRIESAIHAEKQAVRVRVCLCRRGIP